MTAVPPPSEASPRDIPAPLDSPMTSAERSRVLRTAGALFANLGLNNVTLERLAKDSRVPLPRLLAQFPSMASVVSASLSFMEFGLMDVGFQGKKPRGWEGLDAFTLTLQKGMGTPGLFELYSDVNVVATDPQHPAHDWLVGHHRFMLDEIVEAVRTGIEDGTIRPDADANEMHRLMITMLLGVVPAQRALGGKFSLQTVFQSFRRLLVQQYATEAFLAALAAGEPKA